MIAREGLTLILTGAAITAVLLLAAVRWDSLILASLAGVFALLSVFTTFFFRDPPRDISSQPDVLVAPADGRILAIDSLAHHDYIGGETIKISIFLSVFDVHINRIPTAGVIDFAEFHPGAFFSAFKDEASRDNQHSEIGMVATGGHRIVVKQITGSIARRIIYHLKPGQKVATGERFGLIRFGSRTELFVPVGSDIEIKVGDKVKGGLTIIGRLPEAQVDETQTTALGQDRQL
ncbi:MAG: phosphatidylserine decarboxylase family protein [bacterium]